MRLGQEEQAREEQAAAEAAQVKEDARLAKEQAKADEKAAREAAIKRLAEEQYASLRKKTSRARKGATEVQQMSLF